MDGMLGIVVFAMVLIGGLVWISRYQSNQYRLYLDKQVAETAKMAESQRSTLEAVERQTAALERIADALARDRA